MSDRTDLLERIAKHVPPPAISSVFERRDRRVRRQRLAAGTLALALTIGLVGSAIFVLRDRSDGRVVGGATPQPGRIAFTVRENAGWHVATVSPDGTDRRVLTDGLRDYATSWSPDGSQIAYDTDLEDDGGGIWIMDADGGNRRQVTNGTDMFPRWSPDGEQILFSRHGEGMFPADEFTRYGTAYLWVMNADGTGERQLTDGKLFDVPGSWSPDGTRITFLRSSEDGSGIWIIGSDGTEAHEIVHLDLQLDGSPAWSPDGSEILYPTDGSIWAVNADGTDPHRLIEAGTDPAWSPDGTQITYGHNGDIWVVDADGQNARQVTTHPDEEIQPSWGPGDGETAFDAGASPATGPVGDTGVDVTGLQLVATGTTDAGDWEVVVYRLAVPAAGGGTSFESCIDLDGEWLEETPDDEARACSAGPLSDAIGTVVHAPQFRGDEALVYGEVRDDVAELRIEVDGVPVVSQSVDIVPAPPGSGLRASAFVAFIPGGEEVVGIALDSAGEEIGRKVLAQQSIIPDVIGLAEDEARARLEAVSLVVAIKFEPSEDTAEGLVAWQDPPAGNVARPGSSVTIVVSEGPGNA